MASRRAVASACLLMIGRSRWMIDGGWTHRRLRLAFGQGGDSVDVRDPRRFRAAFFRPTSRRFMVAIGDVFPTRPEACPISPSRGNTVMTVRFAFARPIVAL